MISKNKNIGIITFYYNCSNYGALLQAYALVSFLNTRFSSVEQICYDESAEYKNCSFSYAIKICKSENIGLLFRKLFSKFYLNFKNGMSLFICTIFLKPKFDKKNTEMSSFREDNIPHSNNIYIDETLHESNQYDVYITGSDQVWNFNNLIRNGKLSPAYWLTFVHNKKKIAYAASPSLKHAKKEWYGLIREALRDYTAISVREKNSLAYLLDILTYKDQSNSQYALDIIKEKSTYVLDPVFLLKKQQWERILDTTSVPNQKYVFCYFLGDSKKQRKCVRQFCQKHQFLIVDIPYALGNFRLCDYKFADKGIYCGPRGFLALISNAEYVFTDSFHATAFSLIFHKNFYAFKRYANGKEYNNDRIKDVLEIAGCRKRLVDEEKINLLWKSPTTETSLNYVIIQKQLDKEIKRSKEFLINSIET